MSGFAFEPVERNAPEGVSPYELRVAVSAGLHSKTYLAFSGGVPVAVRIYRFGLGSDPAVRARMTRAVTVAKSINNEVAAPVLGCGFANHRMWLATAYQPGPSLADAVFQRGRLPREGVRRLALALTGLVGELHLVGLAGRGLTPTDVVLTRGGPRVVDLGFARVEGGAGGTADAIPGRYASGGPALAADVRDIGAILYFAATGRRVPDDPYDIVSPSVGDCPDALREPIAASQRADPAARPSLSGLAAAASTSHVPATTAVQWESAPWLPNRVAEDIDERSDAVAALQRRGTWPEAYPPGFTRDAQSSPGGAEASGSGASGPADRQALPVQKSAPALRGMFRRKSGR